MYDFYFFSYSSQVLFSISQKLIQHQIVNYTEILKWLREILVCRNTFLLPHKEYANVGSNVAICKQAHIKLEVNFRENVGRNHYVCLILISVIAIFRWYSSCTCGVLTSMLS